MTATARMITIDCVDPRMLADWWAKAFGGEIVADFDGWYVVLGAEPVNFGFQRVSTEKRSKNRVHVDFGSDDRAAEVQRLVGMGATKVADHTVPGGGFSWTVLLDPAGNEFCVSG